MIAWLCSWAWLPFAAWALCLDVRHLWRGWVSAGWWAIASALLTVYSATQRERGWAALMAVSTAVSAWMWWRNRRNRKRKHALREFGAKSRARLAALVRKSREAAKPRPVYRPQPQGSP